MLQLKLGAIAEAALLLAACSSSGVQESSSDIHYYCSAASNVRGTTLVVTEQVFPFSGPISSFKAEAPKLQASFAAYAANTWGMTIEPVCTPEVSESAAETARRAEVGRYQGQGDAIWRVSYWRPS